MNLNIKTITAVLSMVGVIAGGVWGFEVRYAKAANVEKLEQRVLTNELNQQYRDARSEVYFLKSQVRKYPDDQDLKKELEKAIDEMNRLKKKLEPKKSEE